VAAAVQNIYDRYSRFAVKLDPDGFLRWLLRRPDPDLRFRRWLESQPAARPGEPERRCDTVAELQHASGRAPPWALLIELQIGPDPDMLERLLEYLGRTRRDARYDPQTRDKYLVAAAVVNLSGVQAVPRLDMVLPGETGNEFHWSPTVRNLEEESAAELLTEMEAGRVALCLLPWVSLMAGGDRPDIIEQWKTLASRETDPHKRADYGALVLIFSRITKREDVWRTGLKEWNMSESTIIDEWVAKGESQGEVKGKAAGLVEGRAQAFQVSLIEFLSRFFPQGLPPDLLATINTQQEPAELERWLKLVYRANSADEVRAAIGLKSNGSQSP
jgi:hypothetical protein